MSTSCLSKNRLTGCFLACLLLQAVHTSVGTERVTRILRVGQQLTEEALLLEGGVAIYELHGLKPLTAYEVKVSYPASLPASFKLEQVEDLDTKSVDVRSRPGGRKALDIEKIIVQTDSSGHLLGQGKGRGPGVRRELALIRVSVQPAGVMGAFGGGNVKEIVFNIECEELLLGVPLRAWPVAGIAVLILILLVLAFALGCFPRFMYDQPLSLHEASKTLKSSVGHSRKRY